MADLILFKRSSTPGAIPAAGQLTTGEMAVNTADGKLYTKNSNGTVVEIGASGGGVTDHGALTGLNDDDHAQYHNDARGDARYSQLGHTHAAADIVSGSIDIARIPTGTTSDTVCIGNDSRLSDARTPTAHTHALTDLTRTGAADGDVATWNETTSQWEPQTPSGGGFSAEIPWLVPASTEYIAAAPVGVTATTLAMTANRMYLMPFIPAFDFSCSALGVSVTTAVSSSLARVCVYASGANGRPTGSALVSTIDLNCASTGTKEDATNPYSFTAGTQYWLGVHSSSTQTLRAYTAATAWSLLVVPTTTAPVVGFYQSSTFSSGAPSIGSLTSNTGSSPYAYMKGT